MSWLTIKPKLIGFGLILLTVLAAIARMKYLEKKVETVTKARDKARSVAKKAKRDEEAQHEQREERKDEEKKAEKDIADGKVPDSLGDDINDWD